MLLAKPTKAVCFGFVGFRALGGLVSEVFEGAGYVAALLKVKCGS